MISRRVRRRILRAIPIAAVLMLLLTSLYLVSTVEQEATQLGRLAQWIFALAGVAVVVLLAVIVGRAVRLVDRLRAGRPGARLAARLVAVFVVLTLPPVVILYLFAIQFLSDTIEGWMDIGAEQALADSIELGQMFLSLRTRDVRGEIARLAGQLDSEDADRLFDQLLRQVSSAGPTDLAVLDASGSAVASASIRPGRLVAERPGDFALSQALQDEEYAAAEPGEEGLRIRVLHNLGRRSLGGEVHLLQAIYPLPAEFEDLAERIESAYHRYQNVAYLRARLHQSLVLILSLVLLLTVLLAMLLAFNSARRLTQPIRDLALATEELAAGRFPGDLEVTSRDELGFLVRSFNTMTRELAASRRQLEAQRRYLAIVLGRLSAGVLAIDAQGQISAFNDSAARILSLQAEDDGRALTELSERRPDLAPLLDLLAKRHAGPGSDWRQEIKLGSAEQPLVLVCRGSELPAETGGHVVVFDDVTVLDQAQREAAWAEVARRLAHEVKNPLTPIQLAAERLAWKLDGSLEAEERALLARATGTIRAQVDALRRLVDSFGDYARPARLKLERIDPLRILRETVDLYASGDMPIVFEVSAPDEELAVLADAGQLRQLFINIIRNAQEARGGEQAHMRIVLRAEESGRERPGVSLSFSDDGPGFSDELLERIFEPYVTTKPRGSGLGLAIVRRIVEDHGGSIAVANGEAGGAVVRIWLPAG